ncbi:MAG: hypothetical protein IPM22_10820 [Betaproteobacteria bacterium]|nr:hypothetical protein [Betaproteobacteria bacterium]MCC7215606.1 hypothetical protein [Burkholderiales bacterium]
MTPIAADASPSARPAGAASCDALPAPAAWLAAAAHHGELFAPLDPGVRIALIARTAPSRMLVWEAGDTGLAARIEPFAGYADSAAEIVLAADDESLADVRAASAERLFAVLRAGIRSGRVVCYMLQRRCVLEARGCDELLDALGFAFMGACR